MAFFYRCVVCAVWALFFAGSVFVHGQGSASLGSLSIDVKPPHASIFVDRTERGQSPVNLSLAPGEHLVEVRSDGYKPQRRSVKISEGTTLSMEVGLERIEGLVLVTSDPEGAGVSIDGISYGTTPALITSLGVGSYEAALFLGGYRETKVKFSVKDRVPVKVAVPLISETAVIDVSANVDDVQIKINGIPRGMAPCVIDKVTAGDVIIEATKEGYKPFTQMTKIAISENLKVDIVLEVEPAALNVVSLPDKARVYVDNSFKGETPFSMAEIAPGEHRIRVEKQGFDTIARTLVLGNGEEVTEEFRLKANTGKLTITSQPEGVSIFIDGVKVGETPASNTKGLSNQYEIPGIAEGKHSLKFVKPGYIDKTGQCEIKRGVTVTQRVVLERLFIPNYEVVTDTGTSRGVLESISGGVIRLETNPGVIKSFRVSSVLSHGKIE